MKFGKKYKKVLELVDIKKQYSIEEACELVKKTSITKFDATVDVSFSLGVDTTLADQQVRGTLTLPHGNGKKVKILALTNTKAEDAKAAGADYVGAKELLDKVVQQNWFDFDVIVCTPDMMGEIGKAGRILGPKGLMPNPKAGTVAPDIKKAITEIKSGKVEYRVDKDGNLGLTIGRVSFETKDLIDNLKLICETIMKVRPSTVKNTYVKNAVVHTTMGPGVHFTFEGRN